MIKNINVLPNVYLKTKLGKLVRIWFDQPAREHKGYLSKNSAAKKVFSNPI